ncbi:MAG TPA: DinB family protein [Ramlibacter sp.]|nr:DinB family protein [Ramlibacter sp.]
MEAAPLIENYRYLARYNAWFNERLYDACEQLADAERRRDRGAFFGSIHGTLNHIVWADQLWLQRFAAQGGQGAPLDPKLLALPPGAMYEAVLFEEWGGLRAHRRQLDAAIERWVDAMPANFPLQTMRYANSKGVQREHPVWKALTHFFNHQTHHRGQVTTLLMQAGVDPGVTDMIVLAQEQ